MLMDEAVQRVGVVAFEGGDRLDDGVLRRVVWHRGACRGGWEVVEKRLQLSRKASFFFLNHFPTTSLGAPLFVLVSAVSGSSAPAEFGVQQHSERIDTANHAESAVGSLIDANDSNIAQTTDLPYQEIIKEDSTLLTLAAKNGDEQCIIELIKEGQSRGVGQEGRHPSDVRCCMSSQAVHYRTDHAKANLEATDKEASTALMVAAENGHEECALQLIKAKANLEAATHKGGFTALMFAVENGHEECALQLIKAKANLEAATHKGGFTALMIAAEKGHEECALQLIKAKANLEAATHAGAPLRSCLRWRTVTKRSAPASDQGEDQPRGDGKGRLHCGP